MDASSRRWRRRQYVINKGFQWRFVAVMLGAAVCQAVFIYATSWVFFALVAKSLAERGLESSNIIFRMLDTLHGQLNLAYLVTTFVIVVFMGIVGIWYSHKIAGPLFNLTRHLNRMADGAEPSPVRFRRGDLFPEVQTAFNRFIGRLRPEQASPAPVREAS